MKREFQIQIDFANDWNLYSHAWMKAMKDLYWFKESPVFDFNKYEEIDEMRSDFDKPENLFIAASLSDTSEIIGVLGLRHDDIMARIRRWEPRVLPDYRNSNAGRMLLERAQEHLRSIGVKRIGYLLKYPFTSPGLATELVSEYRSQGFELAHPDSVDLVIDLQGVNRVIGQPSDVSIETGEGYTFEDLASLTVNSFTSTPEEREIHGFDKTVTEHIQATALLQRMADGHYGYSPDEFRKVAVIDGVPVGFLGAFVTESKYKPLTGVLGPMAVLPDYRRRGIALYLVRTILNSLKDHGCRFAAVGTPVANAGAIKLYEKAGFQLSCRLVQLVKAL